MSDTLLSIPDGRQGKNRLEHTGEILNRMSVGPVTSSRRLPNFGAHEKLPVVAWIEWTTGCAEC
jgi:hypothetical protein